ncbi:MAG: fused MFS/spermidine synthase [Methylococcales bacterium]|nr:fused MFS/spermidine synthase [Methylococcales bacterium]
MIYPLIFLSGAASLLYELAWIRHAALVFGSSAWALSTVLAVFFLGLGLGSYGFGRLAVRVRQPLLVCAGIELLLAAYGVSSPAWFVWAEQLYGEYYRSQLSANSLLLLRGGLVAVVLLPPTLLMGGTLPLFCRQLIHSPALIPQRLSLVYGVNTLGAAAGCLLAGFVLLPLVGLTHTLYWAAGINAITGLGFYWLARLALQFTVDAPAPQLADTQESANKPLWLLGLGVLFFMMGAAALAYELVWARFLTQFIRQSVYTYTLTLGVVLLGMALGSFGFGASLSRTATQPRQLLRWFASLQALSALLLVGLSHLPAGFWQTLQAVGWWPIALLMLPSALVAGACFPLLNQLASNRVALLPRYVGLMTGINIVGCVLGALLAGFYLLPHWGLDTGFYVLTAWIWASAVLALLLKPATDHTTGARWGSWLAVGSAALVWLGLLVFSTVRIPQDYMLPDDTLLDFVEGYNSNLAVVEHGQDKALLIDRLWQGVAKRNYQVMVAHIPMLHYPDAQKVLVIGLGAGNTASRFLEYPLSQLDIVDIEPRLFAFTRKHFPSDWMDDPRVKLLAEDGRNYVKHTASQYDFISVEIGQLHRPGVGVFYTSEFYQEAKAKLSAQGMICQFVPLVFLRPEEFTSILQTFLAVFPKAQLWYNTNELLLMGFKGDSKPLSADTFAVVTAAPAIKADFDLYYWGGYRYKLNDFGNFMGNFLAADAELKALADSIPGQFYTDDKLQLSYSVSDYQRADKRATAIVPLIQQHLSPISVALAASVADSRLLEKASDVRALNVADIAAQDALWLKNPKQETPSARYQRAKAALQINPKNTDALGLMLRAQFEMTER